MSNQPSFCNVYNYGKEQKRKVGRGGVEVTDHDSRCGMTSPRYLRYKLAANDGTKAS